MVSWRPLTQAISPRTLDLLETGQYRLVPRMTVMAELNGLTDVGVNDVVVEKIDSQRLIELEVEVDSEPMLSYRADGVVISTPTGSTAYSSRRGVPLLDNRVEGLVLTPVAPHSLFSRALVISPESLSVFGWPATGSPGVGGRPQHRLIGYG